MQHPVGRVSVGSGINMTGLAGIPTLDAVRQADAAALYQNF